MRERSPDVWELIVEAGRDPVTGRRRQVSRTFRGSMRDAKKARAELLVEATKGRHSGSKAKLDDLYADWILDLSHPGLYDSNWRASSFSIRSEPRRAMQRRGRLSPRITTNSTMPC